ncbi:Lysine-specific demethylase 8 [Mortierella sp. GBA30]|nr:Lysine-specific demethylase 8 [Mortierella sp. GBA30]
MFKDLASKFRCIWSNHHSGKYITAATCGHAPWKALHEARTSLSKILDANSSPSNALLTDQTQALILRAEALLDYAREMLHAYPYRDVPGSWRELYTEAGVLKALALALFDSCTSTEQDRTLDVDPLKLAIAACDNVLVMVGASGAGRKSFVFELIEALEKRIDDREAKSTTEPSAPKRRKTGSTAIKLGEEPKQGPMPEIMYPIPRMHLPTMDAFQRHVLGQSSSASSATPLIITGAMDHWPAKERWTDLDTLCRAAGPDRLVPIEIGSQYTDDQWTQKLVTMREFIRQYILCDEPQNLESAKEIESTEQRQASGQQPSIGYLAQHDLFEQIPRLRRDIDIPDYCLIETFEQEGYHRPEDVILNAWFGPRGTISPMHTDPYHNLLAQVVGRKYIRLYAPEETSRLYCYGSGFQTDSQDHERIGEESKEATMLSNTSQVNVEHPDLDQHPLFAEAPYVETILEPGELLYIPFQWWHYIRSLSTSFSVSFWF